MFIKFSIGILYRNLPKNCAFGVHQGNRPSFFSKEHNASFIKQFLYFFYPPGRYPQHASSTSYLVQLWVSCKSVKWKAYLIYRCNIISIRIFRIYCSVCVEFRIKYLPTMAFTFLGFCAYDCTFLTHISGLTHTPVPWSTCVMFKK